MYVCVLWSIIALKGVGMESKKRGRPKGSKNKTPEERQYRRDVEAHDWIERKRAFKESKAAEYNEREADKNRSIINFTRELFMLDDFDYEDVNAIKYRFYEYLDICDTYGVKPMVNSMCTALKISKNAFWGLVSGNYNYPYRNVTADGIRFLQQCYDFLQTSWETSLTAENGNPCKWFFLGKNYFGYEDTTVHINRDEPETKMLPTVEEVTEKYALDVGKVCQLPSGD